MLGVVVRVDGKEAAPAVGAWELPAGAALQTVDVTARRGWKPMAPDRPKAWPAVWPLKTRPSLVLFPTGGDQVVLVAKGSGKEASLAPGVDAVDRHGRASGRLSGIELIDFHEGEAIVGFAAGDARARLRLGLGRYFVEVVPGGSAAAVQVRGTARFSFIPDFFGNDVLYDPCETTRPRCSRPPKTSSSIWPTATRRWA